MCTKFCIHFLPIDFDLRITNKSHTDTILLIRTSTNTCITGVNNEFTPTSLNLILVGYSLAYDPAISCRISTDFSELAAKGSLLYLHDSSTALKIS